MVVNYSPQQSQCFVRMSFAELGGRTVRFQDLLSAHYYDRPGDDLLSRGLFVDIPAWGYHVFDVHAWLTLTQDGRAQIARAAGIVELRQ